MALYTVILAIVIGAVCRGDQIVLKNGVAVQVEDIVHTYKGVKVRLTTGSERTYSYDEIEEALCESPNELAEAKALASKGDFGSAKAVYTGLLKNKKPSVVEEARIGLMECLVGSGDVEAALDLYVAVLKDNADTVFFSRFPLAADAAEAERLLGAIRQEKASLEGGVSSQMADVVECYALIAAKKELQSVPDRIADIESAADERLSSLAKILKAQYLLSQGKYEESVEALSDYKELNRFTLPLAHFWRGRSLFELGRYDRAALAFLKIRILYADFHQLACGALLMSARCFERLGELEKAADLYREVVSRFPFSKSWTAQAKARLEELE